MGIKEKMEKLIDTDHSRRKFIKTAGKVIAVSGALPFLTLPGKRASAAPRAAKKPVAQKAAVPAKGGHYILLKNGLIVDGTGKKGFTGDLLIRDDKIEKISESAISTAGPVLDCSGLVIMPGIIDAHSHMDRYMPIQGYDEIMKLPFTEQGVTTFVAGHCGYGTGGFRKNSLHLRLLEKKLPNKLYSIQWDTMTQYFDRIKRSGMTHNMMTFVGHGTTRASIRGFNPTALSKDEMTEMLALLEQAMDEGAAGVSLGLQYEPGIFAGSEELRAVARLVKRKNKILTVHNRAFSALAPGYPTSVPRVILDKLLPFDGYAPHNLIAIDEMLDVARDTGVRLQISHLIFVGERTFKTCDSALHRIDNAIKQGVDVKFDTYSYHCGQSIINVIMPAWFLAKVPQAYTDKTMLEKLKKSWNVTEKFLGFGNKDIQITCANTPKLDQYNGMFLSDIAAKRGMDWFETTMDIAKQSNGSAQVLMHRYSNLPIIEKLMRHPASIFMTDALPMPQGVQNPALSGNFPRFFQLAREKKLIALEEAVYKMSGAAAGRYGIRDRGCLTEGLAADVTVIDWKNIRDNNTVSQTSNRPSGVEAVFINGRQVLAKGKADGSVKAGVVVI